MVIGKGWFFSVLVFGVVAFAQTAPTKTETVRGWLSDEHCAGGKARQGIYGATNPECAKECVAKGYKIVLIDPQQKRILLITNQEMARKNVGDYVEVTGVVDPQASAIAAESIKFLERVSWPPSPPPTKDARP